MKRWLWAALFAAVLAGTGATAAEAQETPPPFMAHAPDVPGGRGLPIPAPIILAKDHPMHGTVFASRLNKSSYWRAEVTRKGYDVAFNEWMQQDHPFEYATYCTQEAKKTAAAFKNTGHYSEFNALLPKREDLRSAVHNVGFDAAFSDWLRREHPDVYRKHFVLEKKIDPSMNDKQMKRGMPM